MKEQLYVKRGRRYIATSDPWATEGLSEGCWIVTVGRNAKTCRKKVQPAINEVLCAVQLLENMMCEKMAEAEKPYPPEPLKGKQLKAFKAYEKIMNKGDVRLSLRKRCMYEIVEAGTQCLRDYFSLNYKGQEV